MLSRSAPLSDRRNLFISPASRSLRLTVYFDHHFDGALAALEGGVHRFGGELEGETVAHQPVSLDPSRTPGGLWPRGRRLVPGRWG